MPKRKTKKLSSKKQKALYMFDAQYLTDKGVRVNLQIRAPTKVEAKDVLFKRTRKINLYDYGVSRVPGRIRNPSMLKGKPTKILRSWKSTDY